MRLYLLLLIISVAGCSNVHHVKTGHYTVHDGVTYERQYWVIQTEPRCVGSCLEQPPKSQHYNYMKRK